jgi:hypothetical protein
VCRLRSIGRSVFLHGNSGRNDVAVAGASSSSATGAASRPAGTKGAVLSAASARSPLVAGSDAPSPCPSSVVGAVVSSAARASSSATPGASPSSRAAASGPPVVIRGTWGMAIQSPSVMNWGRGGVPPNRTRIRS